MYNLIKLNFSNYVKYSVYNSVWAYRSLVVWKGDVSSRKVVSLFRVVNFISGTEFMIPWQ